MRAVVRRLGPRGVVGLAVVLAVVLLVGVGPLVSAYGAERPDFGATLAPPSWRHLLGTDELGRDVLARVLVGGRVSLLVATGGVAAAAVLGVPFGLWCGFRGGWADRVGMRGVEVLLALPGILLALGITAALGASGFSVGVAVAAVNLPVLARVARGQARGLRLVEFVEAARAVGRRPGGVLLFVVAPNAGAAVVTQATVLLAAAILLESTLSFLGLGVQPPVPSWGTMLRDATGFLDQAAWLAWFPGLALFAIVLGFNLLGDGLRDGLDPRTAARR